MKIRLPAMLALIGLLTLNSQLSTGHAQGTAFTYQGRLSEGGVPANGSYDLRFTLADTAGGGTILAGPLTNSAVAVSNGLFTTTLDFGEGVFNGEARWLELAVRSAGTPANFTVLFPRQRLTPTPYAVFAPKAGTAITAQGVAPGTVGLPGLDISSVDIRYVKKTGDTMSGPLALPVDGLQAGGNQLALSGGNVGIGTTTPGAKLDVAGNGRMWGLEISSVWSAVAMNVTWDDGGGTWRRLGDGYATLMQQSGSGGGLNWTVADTDSAGSAVNWKYPLQLTKDGDVVIDSDGANTNGTLTGGLRFGWSGSGEGIASKRSEGGNQWGLDFYTGNQPRLSIANNGNVGIGTTNPQTALHVVGNITADSFFGPGGGLMSIGTPDNQPLEFMVNGQRALRLEPTAGGLPNVVGGTELNSVSPGVEGAVVGGGDGNTIADYSASAAILGGSANGIGIDSSCSAIGGGWGNTIADNSTNATISGGGDNYIGINCYRGTIGGGSANRLEVNSRTSTIGGGFHNIIGTNSYASVIGGGHNNDVGNDSTNTTIAGGRNNSIEARSDYATIGGGYQNRIESDSSQTTIAGGAENGISTGSFSTAIGGGYINRIGADSWCSTIAGGYSNDVGTNTIGNTIGGGYDNNIEDFAGYATIPGGSKNFATSFAFAAGRRAKARHTGAFVWADSTEADFASTTGNQFNVRATGGVRLETAGKGVTVDGMTVVAGVVVSNQLAPGSVTASAIAPGSISGSHIIDGTITDADISGPISGGKILGGDLQVSRLQVGSGHDVATFGLGATIAGGHGNRASANDSAVGGGASNSADGTGSSISGGTGSQIIADFGAIGGGWGNAVGGNYASIGGGQDNVTMSSSSRIGGGFANNIAPYSASAAVLGGSANLIGMDSGCSAIGGGWANTIADHSTNATISGGSENYIGLNCDRGTIGGGSANRLEQNSRTSTVGGGFFNSIGTNSYASVIGGGHNNNVGNNSTNSTIAGGRNNRIDASSDYATIGGGYNNTIADLAGYATIPGGSKNSATNHAFAAGNRAKALHTGSFVWADSTDADFASTTNNQFNVRATGGVRLETGGVGLRVDGQQVLSGMVTTGQLGAKAVTAGTIASSAVTGVEIADGSVGASDVNAASLGTLFWKTDGNAGTTSGTHFLGTTDSQPLELVVNGQRALRLQPNGVSAPSVIGGSAQNQMGAGTVGATISGGYKNTNDVLAHYSTIGGGYWNAIQRNSTYATVGGGRYNKVLTNAGWSTIAGGEYNTIETDNNASTIGGGRGNTVQSATELSTVSGGRDNVIGANSSISTIGGGRYNRIGDSSTASTICGGYFNVASANYATVVGGANNYNVGDYSIIGGGTENRIDSTASYATLSGGQYNTNSGSFSTIPGGLGNWAKAYCSFAAGRYAKSLHAGTFVWNDTSNGDFSSTAANQFLIHAYGGVGVNANNIRAEHSQTMLRVSGGHIMVDNNVGLLCVNSAGTSYGAGVDSTTSDDLQLLAGGSVRAHVSSSGNVGIATTSPGFTLHVNGSAGKPGGGSWSVASDERLKKNIRPLRGVLDRLLQLHGVRFEYKDPETIHELPGERMGLIAQEVEPVFPDWVETGPDGMKRLTVRGFEALTIEALRQLREEKDTRIGALEKEVAELKALVNALCGKVNGGVK